MRPHVMKHIAFRLGQFLLGLFSQENLPPGSGGQRFPGMVQRRTRGVSENFFQGGGMESHSQVGRTGTLPIFLDKSLAKFYQGGEDVSLFKTGPDTLGNPFRPGSSLPVKFLLQEKVL